MLQALCQQARAVRILGCRKNQCIPPRIAVTILNAPSALQHRSAGLNRAPSEEIANVRLRGFPVEARTKTLRDCSVVFVEDLEAETTASLLSEYREPSGRFFLFLSVRSVAKINQNVRVNEAVAGHEVRRERGNVLMSSTGQGHGRETAAWRFHSPGLPLFSRAAIRPQDVTGSFHGGRPKRAPTWQPFCPS